MKNILIKKMVQAFNDNEDFITEHIADFAKGKSNLKILDVGCGDGDMSVRLSKKISNSFSLYGVDIKDKSKESEKNFTVYKKADFATDDIPFESEMFDVVFSNQVIEHLLDKDHLLSECYRVLKPNGLFILSTENIASFDNIISLLLGQEPITQHTGNKYNTSSMLSPHFMEEIKDGNKYLHKNVCSYFGLKRLAQVNGFKNVKIKSFGGIFKLFEKLFPTYNRIITIYTIK